MTHETKSLGCHNSQAILDYRIYISGLRLLAMNCDSEKLNGTVRMVDISETNRSTTKNHRIKFVRTCTRGK